MSKNNVPVRKKVGCSVTIGVAALLMIFAFCGRFFHSFLRDVANFFVGSFGMAFYGLMIATIAVCSLMLSGKSLKIPTKYVVHFCLLFFEIVLLVHEFTTRQIFNTFDSYSDYAKYVYNYYSGLPTFGGIVFGSIAYGLDQVLTVWGASVLLFGLMAWSVYSVGDFFYCYFTGKLELTVKPKEKEEDVPKVAQPVTEIDEDRANAIKVLFPDETANNHYTRSPQSASNRAKSPKDAAEFLFHSTESADTFFNNSTENDTSDDTSKEMGASSYYDASRTEANEDDGSWRISSGKVDSKSTDKMTPKSSNVNDGGWITSESFKDDSVDVVDVIAENHEIKEVPTDISKTEVISEDKHEEEQVSIKPVTFDFDDEDDEPVKEEPEVSTYSEPPVEEDEEPFVDEPEFEEPVVEQPKVQEQPAKAEPKAETKPVEAPKKRDNKELIAVEKETEVDGGVQVGFDFVTEEEMEEANSFHHYPDYNQPPLDLLNDAIITEDHDAEYREWAANEIVKKLSRFSISVEAVEPVVGPTVTQFRFRVLSEKTKMSDFNRLGADLKACLEARDEIRIEAPIEGTNLVGVEAANKVRTPVMLRTLLESEAYKQKKGDLVFPIGQEISGNIVVADLAKLPHLLVAGTTGSGKSVFLHSMITSLMYRYGPEYLRFVMVDPKFVELSRYNHVPHMLTSEAILNPADALAAMDYLIAEMESRYQLFRGIGAVNIGDYNRKINPKLAPKLPFLVLVVDELADLMSASRQGFESKLQRLAQKSRAAGIHIVLATQRPDVKTVTGTIKANLPARIGLKVSSPADSMTILSTGGGEKLLGRGDMLFMNPEKAGFTRCQCAYITDDEIFSIVDYIKSQNEAFFDTKVEKNIFVSTQQAEPVETASSSASEDSGEEKLDPYCKKALRFWLERQGGRASIASIQRALKIGFNRAGRIMDSLQKLGYVEEVAPNESNSKPLQVLVTLEELDDLFPDMED